MGTRADFYDTTTNLVWLGSIAWDGDFTGHEANCSFCVRLLKSGDEKFCKLCGRELLTHRDLWSVRSHAEYLKAVKALKKRDDWTSPEQGWPWPWKDSNLTDCAYAWGPAAAGMDPTIVAYHKGYDTEPSGWITPDWLRQFQVEYEEWESWEEDRIPEEYPDPLPMPIQRVGDNPVFPDMTDRQNFTMGRRSGILLVR